MALAVRISLHEVPDASRLVRHIREQAARALAGVSGCRVTVEKMPLEGGYQASVQLIGRQRQVIVNRVHADPLVAAHDALENAARRLYPPDPTPAECRPSGTPAPAPGACAGALP